MKTVSVMYLAHRLLKAKYSKSLGKQLYDVPCDENTGHFLVAIKKICGL
jgi:hypothetical protein